MITGKSGKVKPYKEKKPLRKLADPFVVAPPGAVSTRTRAHPVDNELDKVLGVGMFLGSVARQDLVTLLCLESHNLPNSRAERKKSLTSITSSRWAGSITRSNQDQYDLSLRNLQSYVDTLQGKIGAILKKLALPLGPPRTGSRAGTKTKGKPPSQTPEVKSPENAGTKDELKTSEKVKYGYKDKHEKFRATRRLSALRDKLLKAQTRLSQARPSVTVGGRALLKNRHNLQAAKITEQMWGQKWGAKRIFLTADGDATQHYGNNCIWVDPEGYVHINVPTGLVYKYGAEIVLQNPVKFSHLNDVLQDRITTGGAISYTISYDPQKNRLYITASWKIPEPTFLPLPVHLKSLKHLAIDLNGNHLAAWAVDKHGNTVGDPIYMELDLDGLPASMRDAYVRHVITKLIKIAKERGCGAITIEDLDFSDIRSIGKEKYGKGNRGKKFRKTVLGMPTSQFKTRLVSMCYTADLWAIAVDPAYTSKWGKEHWLKFLQAQQNVRKEQKQALQEEVTGHVAAAACIGRRSHGFTLRRKDRSPLLTREISTGNSDPRRRGASSNEEPTIGLTVERKDPVRSTRDSGYKGKSNSPPLDA